MLAAVALSGCGNDSENETSSEAPTAADGTDYTACDDGTCEVEVAEPVEFDFGDFTFTITAVTEDGIEYETVNDDGGTGSGSMSGGYCNSYLTANSSSSSCYGVLEGTPPEPDPGAGEVQLQLLNVTDGAAVVRFTMG